MLVFFVGCEGHMKRLEWTKQLNGLETNKVYSHRKQNNNTYRDRLEQPASSAVNLELDFDVPCLLSTAFSYQLLACPNINFRPSKETARLTRRSPRTS